MIFIILTLLLYLLLKVDNYNNDYNKSDYFGIVTPIKLCINVIILLMFRLFFCSFRLCLKEFTNTIYLIIS